MIESLVCFGGPLNERSIAADGHQWVAPLSPRAAVMLSHAEPNPMDNRTVTYRLEKVGYHDADLCTIRDVMHNESCHWLSRCWVADGYPTHRITDALTAIAALAGLSAGRSGYAVSDELGR